MGAVQTMQCMEVWGGNQPVDSGVMMAGLDAWVYCRPHADSDFGGDVYYVSSCATGRITRLLVADVSGHGPAVASTAAELRRLMRKYINFIDQCDFVRSMNRQFLALSDASCFATAVVTTFFAPTRRIHLCNAGHPPPLVYRARTRTWSFLEPDASQDVRNIPLGIDDADDYHQFEAVLDLSDLVLCYTDSLIESKSAAGDFLGREGLLQTVRSLEVSDPSRLIPLLLEKIASMQPGNLDSDDVTVLLFRPNGLGATVPLRDRLLAPVRVLAASIKALFTPDPIPRPELTVQNIGGAMISRLNQRDG
jgi:sigma-B regulation protein RsbU (phosphoserine phosphatase)